MYVEGRPDPNVGRMIGSWRIEALIGRGGMGVVYRAARGEEVAAVKVLQQSFAFDPKAKKRFLREAQIASSVCHQNLVRLLEAGEAEEGLYMALEFVAGRSLSDHLDEGRVFTFEEVVDLGRQACQGLSTLHAAGIVHRDVKPANLLLTDDLVLKVADFGLARSGDYSSLSRTGQAMGTPYYMSPEQAKGTRGLDHRADLYSLGATLYHLVAGVPPFQGDSAVAIIMGHVSRQAPPLGDYRPDVPRSLGRAIRKMLAKHPSARHGSAEEVVLDLEGRLYEESLSTGERMRRRSASGALAPRRSTLLVSYGVGAGLLVLLGSLLAIVGGIERGAVEVAERPEEPAAAEVAPEPETKAPEKGPEPTPGATAPARTRDSILEEWRPRVEDLAEKALGAGSWTEARAVLDGIRLEEVPEEGRVAVGELVRNEEADFRKAIADGLAGAGLAVEGGAFDDAQEKLAALAWLEGGDFEQERQALLKLLAEAREREAAMALRTELEVRLEELRACLDRKAFLDAARELEALSNDPRFAGEEARWAPDRDEVDAWRRVEAAFHEGLRRARSEKRVVRLGGLDVEVVDLGETEVELAMGTSTFRRPLDGIAVDERVAIARGVLGRSAEARFQVGLYLHLRGDREKARPELLAAVEGGEGRARRYLESVPSDEVPTFHARKADGGRYIYPFEKREELLDFLLTEVREDPDVDFGGGGVSVEGGTLRLRYASLALDRTFALPCAIQFRVRQRERGSWTLRTGGVDHRSTDLGIAPALDAWIPVEVRIDRRVVSLQVGPDRMPPKAYPDRELAGLEFEARGTDLEIAGLTVSHQPTNLESVAERRRSLRALESGMTKGDPIRHSGKGLIERPVIVDGTWLEVDGWAVCRPGEDQSSSLHIPEPAYSYRARLRYRIDSRSSFRVDVHQDTWAYCTATVPTTPGEHELVILALRHRVEVLADGVPATTTLFPRARRTEAKGYLRLRSKEGTAFRVTGVEMDPFSEAPGGPKSLRLEAGEDWWSPDEGAWKRGEEGISGSGAGAAIFSTRTFADGVVSGRVRVESGSARVGFRAGEVWTLEEGEFVLVPTGHALTLPAEGGRWISFRVVARGDSLEASVDGESVPVEPLGSGACPRGSVLLEVVEGGATFADVTFEPLR